MIGRGRRAGLAGLAIRQLRSDLARTVIAVLGVAVAVLTVTLLIGVGTGVFQTGETYLDESGRDLWVTGGPIEIQPAGVGGFQNPIPDAHGLASELRSHDSVAQTVPMGFQVVYVSPDGEEFDSMLGAGIPGGGPFLDLTSGPGFSGGTHYAGGNYDGPMTKEVIIDPGLASAHNLSVGDTLHVGGTITNARRTEVEVVGISPTFRRFLGTGTVALHLSELQTLTGTAYDDRATVITLSLVEGADPEAVARSLETAYPGLSVRTNQEQFRSLLERQSAVIAGGLSLAVLGVLAGMVLSVNLFLSLLWNQRRDFAVLRAVGGSQSSVRHLAAVEAVIVALFGAGLGLGLSPLVALGLDSLAASLTGFGGLVRIPLVGYLLGAGIAMAFGLLGAAIGVLRVRGADVRTDLSQ